MLTVTRYFQAVILVAASASFAVAQIACTAGCKEVLADSCNTCGANSNCRVYEKPHCRNLNKADTPTVAGYARCVSVSPRQTIKVYSSSCSDFCNNLLPGDSREMTPPAIEKWLYIAVTDRKDCI